jgi:hypothetical protein
MGKFHEITYTSIPSHIPRQLAVDLLHNHPEIIQLNPLVIGQHPMEAPQDAQTDEYFAKWYNIQQRIQYVPGTGKVGSGKINFNGVFHDLPNGVQTHIYAAAGVDLRHNYYIGGNQPGEMLEARELGSDAPSSGLYLKEEKDIKCNKLMLTFVKKELRTATDVLISRLVKKAELVDAGVLHAMMEDGMLKTINPNTHSNTIPAASPSDQSSEFVPSNSNRSSTQPSNFTNPDQVSNRSSQPLAAQQGLGFALTGNIALSPVKSPTDSQSSEGREAEVSAKRTPYQEVSGASAPTYHELPTESNVAPNDRLSGRYSGSQGNGSIGATP